MKTALLISVLGFLSFAQAASYPTGTFDCVAKKAEGFEYYRARVTISEMEASVRGTADTKTFPFLEVAVQVKNDDVGSKPSSHSRSGLAVLYTTPSVNAISVGSGGVSLVTYANDKTILSVNGFEVTCN